MRERLPEATAISAAIAGAWCGIGTGVFEAWTRKSGVSAGDVLSFGATVVFFLLPVYVFVVGRHEPFASTWVMKAEERARYKPIALRMLIWFLVASASGAIVTALG